jgi:hypothetical protein
MEVHRILALAFVSAFALVAQSTAAQTLYKLIDKDGKVTYSETPPKDFDGKVIRMDIDPKANTMNAPKAPAPQAAQPEGKPVSENEKIIRRKVVTNSDRLQAAREKVEAARKAYEDARDNPGEDDVSWIARGANTRPTAQGAPQQGPQQTSPGTPKAPAVPTQLMNPKMSGARPVPTDEYAARLVALEKAWHDAEDELRALEKELR